MPQRYAAITGMRADKTAPGALFRHITGSILKVTQLCKTLIVDGAPGYQCG